MPLLACAANLESCRLLHKRVVHPTTCLHLQQAGIERKATCRSLFSKLLHLAESEELLPSAEPGQRRSLVTDVFGATEDDAAQLRIVSLYEVCRGVWIMCQC